MSWRCQHWLYVTSTSPGSLRSVLRFLQTTISSANIDCSDLCQAPMPKSWTGYKRTNIDELNHVLPRGWGQTGDLGLFGCRTRVPWNHSSGSATFHPRTPKYCWVRGRLFGTWKVTNMQIVFRDLCGCVLLRASLPWSSAVEDRETKFLCSDLSRT